jgi:hypothetical protein
MSKRKTFYAPNDQCVTFQTWPGNKDNKIETYCANGSIKCQGGKFQSKRGHFDCLYHNDDYDYMKKDTGLQLTVYEGTHFGGKNWEMGENEYEKDFGGWWGGNISSFKLKKDCSNAKWIWDDDCLKNEPNTINSDQMYNNTKNFCNEDYEKAFSTNCETWCGEDKDKCYVRNRYLTCEKLEISKNNCNQGEIDKINQQCTSKLSVGAPYECTVSGLAQLEKDCKDLNLPSTCTSNAVATEKNNIIKDQQNKEYLAQQAKLAKEAQENEDERNKQNQENEDKRNEQLAETVTSNTNLIIENKKQQSNENRLQLLNIVGITTPPPKKDDTIMYIIISIVMCILVMSSSSSILGLIVI